MAWAPPRSAAPCRLSASSMMTRRFLPEKLAVVLPLPATFSITDFVRWSLALSSMTSHPMSFARAWALVVFPVPGLP